MNMETDGQRYCAECYTDLMATEKFCHRCGCREIRVIAPEIEVTSACVLPSVKTVLHHKPVGYGEFC